MIMNFDVMTFQMTDGGNRIEYGILHGNEKIVFIKSGKGGDCRGYADKYVKMAKKLHDTDGCTVISASNPLECADSHACDQRMLERYAAERGWASFEVSALGSSNGGYLVLLLATKMPQVKKILCVNMPLMLNYHKTSRALQLLNESEKIFVYGTQDPSYPYLPFLENKALPKCRFVRIEDADHTFSGKTDEFIDLYRLFFPMA